MSFGIQCLSGTGALRVGAEFLKQQLDCSVVLVSDPTWGNHNLIFKIAGFSTIKKYRYWDRVNKCMDFSGMIQDIKDAPERAVVILHGCAHNPTGRAAVELNSKGNNLSIVNGKCQLEYTTTQFQELIQQENNGNRLLTLWNERK